MSSTGNRRLLIWAVTFILVAGLVGFVGGKAFSDVPAQPVAQVDGQERCCSPDAKRLARKGTRRFRAGKIDRDHGFKPGRVFRKPAVARRVFARKIDRYLEKHPKQAERVNCYPVSTCLYDQAVKKSSCVTSGYPATGSGACNRDITNGPGLTKRQVQALGFVVLCGTTVAVGVATAPPSAGGSVAMVAIPAALLCGWEFWIQVDQGSW